MCAETNLQRQMRRQWDSGGYDSYSAYLSSKFYKHDVWHLTLTIVRWLFSQGLLNATRMLSL